MELSEKKKADDPRSSVELLTQMCWEDVPQIDEASLSAVSWRIGTDGKGASGTRFHCSLLEISVFIPGLSLV